ncbi:MAG: chemotaxis protein CheW [Sulfurospirillaceae bacterium]|nr:chemotaxis protein CheW [Sulfurospirillaceae bacterium]
MADITSKNTQGNQFLSFFLKDERFAINVSYVKEIIEYTQITRVPTMERFLVGITNIRGNVIPVLDLSSRLDLGMSKISKKSCIITVEATIGGEENEIGLIVDMVDQVYEITPVHKMDAPEFGAKIRKDFMQMMARIEERFITLLDMNGILDLSELSRVTQKRAL